MKTLTTPFDGTFALIALFSATVGFILFDTFIALMVAISATLIQCFVTKGQFEQERIKEAWIKENKVDYLDEKTFSKAVGLMLKNNWELKLENLSLATEILPSDADEEDKLVLEIDLEEIFEQNEVNVEEFKTFNDICEKLRA